MKFRSIILFIYLVELSFAEVPICIPLGAHCEPAGMLESFGLRKLGLPFDWMLTENHEGFLKILEDDFAHFLDERYIFASPENPNFNENAYYSIEFRHDGYFLEYRADSSKGRVLLDEIKAKYERRIHRFRELKNYPGKVLFFRAATDWHDGSSFFFHGLGSAEAMITASDAIKLKHALRRYFPQLDFTLVIINYLEDCATLFEEIPNVIEFQVRKSHKEEDYRSILQYLGVI